MKNCRFSKYHQNKTLTPASFEAFHIKAFFAEQMYLSELKTLKKEKYILVKVCQYRVVVLSAYRKSYVYNYMKKNYSICLPNTIKNCHHPHRSVAFFYSLSSKILLNIHPPYCFFHSSEKDFVNSIREIIEKHGIIQPNNNNLLFLFKPNVYTAFASIIGKKMKELFLEGHKTRYRDK